MTKIDKLNSQLRLTPFQIYVIAQNQYKYDMDSIKKIGTAIYAPYRSELARDFKDAVQKIFLGPRVDVIGQDKMLLTDRRCNLNSKQIVECEC